MGTHRVCVWEVCTRMYLSVACIRISVYVSPAGARMCQGVVSVLSLSISPPS